MNGSLGESEHGNISVVLIVPEVLLAEFIELVDEVSFVFKVERLFLVVVAAVGGVESADIVLFVNLVAMQNYDHAFLNGFIVFIKEKQKVDLEVCYRVAYCRHVLALSPELLPSILYLPDDSNHIYLMLGTLLQNLIYPRDFLRVHGKVNSFLF